MAALLKLPSDRNLVKPPNVANSPQPAHSMGRINPYLCPVYLCQLDRIDIEVEKRESAASGGRAFCVSGIFERQRDVAEKKKPDDGSSGLNEIRGWVLVRTQSGAFVVR
jgi:hypothetical protein